MKMKHLPVQFLLILVFTLQGACSDHTYRVSETQNTEKDFGTIITGAERLSVYVDKYLNNKNIAVVANQTSLVGEVHLIDTLLSSGVNIIKVFAPEHGFRGEAEAGAVIKSGVDIKTGLPVTSLYGKKKKPLPEDLLGIDIVVFDIQDVGARFYTYISTMTYVMEACAEAGIEFLVLDRPNPHGYYIDGPVLKDGYQSFVGLHKIPVVHGMTIAEYARMVNEEGWLKDGIKCRLSWVSCEGYTHSTRYQLPVRPSPNLPDMEAIYLYPSLCLFEGTQISVGRGTSKPFKIIGHPDYSSGNLKFIPESIPGVSEKPPHLGKECRGIDLSGYAAVISETGKLELRWLIEMYNRVKNDKPFFDAFFDKLAGSDELRKQISAGMAEEEIRQSWKNDLANFQKIRAKYLLYPDF